MKINLKKQVIQVLIFLVAVTLVLYFFPREMKFRYHFQEGKPWRYGLLTASFDFPIYKSEDLLKQEQDSVLRTYAPYYTMDTTVVEKELAKLEQSYDAILKYRITPLQYDFIKNQLRSVYSQGILSAEQYMQLSESSGGLIMLMEGRVGRPRSLAQLNSARTAYEKILSQTANLWEKQQIQECEINKYLTQNLVYDSITSENSKRDLLARIPLSSGMVQVGERIVDRGEIVSPRTYQILSSLQQVSLDKGPDIGTSRWSLLGQILVTMSLFALMYMYLGLFRRKEYHNLRSLIFLILMIAAITIMAFVMSSTRVLGIYLVPFAILPIVVRTFLDSRTALFAHIVTVLLSSFAAPFPIEFLYMQIIAGMVSIFSLHDLEQRSQLARCALFVFLAYCITYITYTMVTEGDLSKLNPLMFAFIGGSSLFLLLAYLLIYLLEKGFGFVSTVTLVELSNINTPLLRKLSELCPGTFQHSLQISNLAAEAAIKIGANSQLVRTGALYHDIGKMENPAFFTENQSGVNPHDQLTYEQSAQIIIGHVHAGLAMAEKNKLPKLIQEFIATHHGTTKTKYFYNSFRNKYPDLPVNESVFTYPGPIPLSKETAILMMADAVEAASRSLKLYDEESISQLVEQIISGQMQDKQFVDSPLTFREMEKVKTVFIEKLKIMYHTRISYPTLQDPANNA